MPARDNPDSPDPLWGSSECAVDEQAARWWLMRSEGLLDDPQSIESKGFRKWYAAHAAHATAWDAMLTTASALNELPSAQAWTLRTLARAATASDGSAVPAIPASPATMAVRVPSAPRRRAFAIQAAMAAVVSLVGAGSWWVIDSHRNQPWFAQAFSTERGKLMDVPLPDGSRLKLDTGSAVQVRLYRDRRDVQLLQGQAMFSVAADTARPFTVDAAQTRVTVVGTRFQVRHVGEGVGVQVEQGRVRVEPRSLAGLSDALATATGSVRLLTAGDSVDADAQGRLSALKSVSPTAIAPWRSGRLDFDDTPLAVALAEFARYGATGLSVRDPQIAALRVTGSYEITKAQDFAQALSRVLPVRLQARGAQTEVVAR